MKLMFWLICFIFPVTNVIVHKAYNVYCFDLFSGFLMTSQHTRTVNRRLLLWSFKLIVVTKFNNIMVHCATISNVNVNCIWWFFLMHVKTLFVFCYHFVYFYLFGLHYSHIFSTSFVQFNFILLVLRGGHRPHF